MKRLKKFLLQHFLNSFLTLFIPFFIVISIIYILKISNLSYKANLDFKDFSLLYIYVLPNIFFATIPLTFIGAVINAFSKASSQNELIAVFSIGYLPLKIFKSFFITAILFTILLTIISIYLLPIANQKIDNFQQKKIFEAKLKILPKKLNQNFGKHHIFIEENINNSFKNITMFTTDNNAMQILFAKKGEFKKDNNISYLSLYNGKLYRYKDKNFQIINFEKLNIYNNKKYFNKPIKSVYNYWKNKTNHFFYYLLISFTPILFLLGLIAFGIYNPRYEKNRAPFYILLSALIVYIPAMILKENGNIYLFIAFLVAIFSLSIIIFNKRLKRY